MDQRLAARPDTYLYTVMVFIPLVVNVGQAWIQDWVSVYYGHYYLCVA